MAGVKISELPAATSVGSTDSVVIVQSGATKRATVDQVQTAVLSYSKLLALGAISLNSPV